MAVQFFGRFLTDRGEVDEFHVREALMLMEAENATPDEHAIGRAFTQERDVVRVSTEHRARDASSEDLAVEMGSLGSEELVELLRHQHRQQLQFGEALVQLGYLEPDRLGVLLDAFQATQAQYEIERIDLPDALANHRATRHVLELFPRFTMRVARIHARVGSPRVFDEVPEFAELRVSIPIRGVRGLQVSLLADAEFAQPLAVGTRGLERASLEPEMVRDGVTEFLNLLLGTVITLLAQDGHCLELGMPDYEAELCDGWIVDLAVDRGHAALVLSLF